MKFLAVMTIAVLTSPILAQDPPQVQGPPPPPKPIELPIEYSHEVSFTNGRGKAEKTFTLHFPKGTVSAKRTEMPRSSGAWVLPDGFGIDGTVVEFTAVSKFGPRMTIGKAMRGRVDALKKQQGDKLQPGASVTSKSSEALGEWAVLQYAVKVNKDTTHYYYQTWFPIDVTEKGTFVNGEPLIRAGHFVYLSYRSSTELSEEQLARVAEVSCAMMKSTTATLPTRPQKQGRRRRGR